MQLQTTLLAVLGLYVLQTLLPPALRYLSRGLTDLPAALGPRDQAPPLSPLAGRLSRALNNLQEALFVFLPVALLLIHQGQTGGWAARGAMIFLLARIAYVPAYASGVSGLRSLIWVIGHAGIAAMVLALTGVLAA